MGVAYGAGCEYEKAGATTLVSAVVLLVGVNDTPGVEKL